MKTCVVILLLVLCCSAQEERISAVNLPAVSETHTGIIRDWPTTIEKYPYVVQVQYNGRLACGGSLLTRRHVLTAAHCFFDSNGNLMLHFLPSFISVRVETDNLQSGRSVHSVSKVILHEQYNSPPRDNDVAVMLLSSAVTLSAQVQVASIPAQEQRVPDNSTVSHVGWGRTIANVNQAAPVLQEVDIFTINTQTCAARYQFLGTLTGEPYPVTDNMICSGLLDVGGAYACQGHSGGPLVYSGVVVGITSWRYSCAEPLFPGVNARISAYTNWINQTVLRYNAGPPSTSTNVILLALSAIICLSLASR